MQNFLSAELDRGCARSKTELNIFVDLLLVSRLSNELYFCLRFEFVLTFMKLLRADKRSALADGFYSHLVVQSDFFFELLNNF